MAKPPCLRPVAGLLFALLCPGLRAAEPAPTTPDEVTPLPKLVVQGNAVCSYGFGVIAKWNNQTQKLTSVTIDDVSPSSTAEKNGLKRGDEIISINNRKITDLKGGMHPGSDLSELLVNQLNGRVIYLEVAVRTKEGASMLKRISLTASNLLPRGAIRR